jgi:hypothetical protein
VGGAVAAGGGGGGVSTNLWLESWIEMRLCVSKRKKRIRDRKNMEMIERKKKQKAQKEKVEYIENLRAERRKLWALDKS